MLYLNWEDLRRALDYDIEQERAYSFRNALVRANYQNVPKGIEYTPVYLERFFRNLLFGEQWDLRNRYIHPTTEWSVQPNLADPTSTRQDDPSKREYESI